MTPKTGALFMRIVALAFGIYAILWGLAPFPELNLPAKLILDISDWPIDALNAPLDRNTIWLSSISAGLLAAVAIFLGFIVAPEIQNKNSSICNTTVCALLAWYVIDGIGSYAAGVISNIVFNTVYLAAAIAPIVLTQPYFSKSQEK